MHVGYLIRVAAADCTRSPAATAQVVLILRRSSLYFAIVSARGNAAHLRACWLGLDGGWRPLPACLSLQGLRLFFAFGPLVMYVLGELTW